MSDEARLRWSNLTCETIEFEREKTKRTKREAPIKILALSKFLELSKSQLSISPDEAIAYSISARDLAVKLKYYRGTALALKYIGMGYYNQSKYAETIENWNQSNLIFVSLGDRVNVK